MKKHQLSGAVAIAALVCCMQNKTFAQTDWHITGNSGTNATNNFVGTTDNVPLAFRTNNAVRMRINGNGNIGIGTTAPVQRLDVNGNLNIRGGFALFMNNHQVLRTDSLNRNTFLGVQSGGSITSGFSNTATGAGALFANNTGSYNTANGMNALSNNTTGNINVATGGFALYFNNTGGSNTANGYAALYKNTSGTTNDATGSYALYSNTTGGYNSAAGGYALYNNTTGSYNIAQGYSALYSNISGINNTAVGSWALYNNKASYNTATGYNALYSNIDGAFNTAEGNWALYNNKASYNTATGYTALYSNTTGSSNTAHGYGALYHNSTGLYNTGVGYGALYYSSASNYNTALGYLSGDSYRNGWNNVFVGANTDANGPDYYNVVAIGQGTICTDVSQARIGNSATTSIGGYANWTNISDVRVKKNIKENVPGLAFINKLKPITYNLDLEAADKIIQPPVRKDIDGKIMQPAQQELDSKKAKEQVIYTGFAAQDVEKAAKELNYDFSGVDAAKNSKSLYGLRYAEFVVPLVKAVQELSQKVEKLEAALAQNNSGSLSSLSSTNVTITDASLGQNIPNPFNRNTSISYTLPQKFSSAQIIVNDQNGKIVKQVNISGAGKGVVNVDASALSSGTYSYTLVVDGKHINSKQMMLAK